MISVAIELQNGATIGVTKDCEASLRRLPSPGDTNRSGVCLQRGSAYITNFERSITQEFDYICREFSSWNLLLSQPPSWAFSVALPQLSSI